MAAMKTTVVDKKRVGNVVNKNLTTTLEITDIFVNCNGDHSVYARKKLES